MMIVATEHEVENATLIPASGTPCPCRVRWQRPSQAGLWTREEDHRSDCSGLVGAREGNRPRRESLARSAVQRYGNPPTATAMLPGGPQCRAILAFHPDRLAMHTANGERSGYAGTRSSSSGCMNAAHPLVLSPIALIAVCVHA